MPLVVKAFHIFCCHRYNFIRYQSIIYFPQIERGGAA